MSLELREELLGVEGMSGAAVDRYRAQLDELMSRKLSAGGRLRYLAPLLGGGAVALALTALAASEPASTPLATRLLLLALAAIGAAWAVLAGRVLRRGSVDLIGDRRAFATAALVFTVAQAGFFAWRATESSTALPGLVLSLAFVVLATGLFVAQRVRESELRIREQQLRAELRGRRS